ncbi:MAG: substrate-binding domain-containing protein [Flavobacteriaceae bacterium]
MKNFKIGGVPEHFNLPWYLLLKNKTCQKQGIDLRWKDYYGGTGQMNNALRDKEIDMAIILTEGIVRDIVEGNNSKIVQEFVESPLIWGIHVATNSEYQNITQLRGTRVAISRYGSGSHLMAYINAQNQGWDTKTDLKFEEISDLEGALKALPNGQADYFMWEKFTTKPYVDNGIFRRLGNCPTPWPCFVIAVRNDVLENDPESVKIILDTINGETKNFKQIPEIDKMISERYNQKPEDVREWLSLTKWSQHQLKTSDLNEIQEQLWNLELVTSRKKSEEILFNF